ncbi:MAG: hypothetical protein WDN44_02330 [Sphingomonas sp.]
MKIAKQALVFVAVSAVFAIGTGVAEKGPLGGAGPLPYGPYTCKPGLVWREAVPGDLVCVSSPRRQTVRGDNAQAAARRQPGGGAYGPDTCRVPFVWREAWPSDHVCVPGAERDQVRAENAGSVLGLVSPTSVPRGPVSTHNVWRDTNSRDLEARGSGFSPNGQVVFYGINSARAGLRTLGSVTADAGGNIGTWTYFETVDITTANCQHNPYGIIVADDVRTGKVIGVGEQKYVCW